MPYKLVTKGSQHCVVVSAGPKAGKVVKCHPSRGAALAHLRALYKNVSEASMSRFDTDTSESQNPRSMGVLALAAEAPTGKKPPAVIFDIDGTLSSAMHRAWLVEGKNDPKFVADWGAFHGGMSLDAPIVQTVQEAKKARAEGKAVILLTLRPERFRDVTKQWMRDIGVPYDELYLRPANTYGNGPETKRQIYKKFIEPRFDVKRAYDDWDNVLAMWKSEGIPTTKITDPHLPARTGVRAARDPVRRPAHIYVPGHMSVSPNGRPYFVRPYWRNANAVERLGFKVQSHVAG